MPTLNTTAVVAGELATAAAMNANLLAIEASVNGIENVQIASDADIEESKIAFNAASGHDHGGGADGKTVISTGYVKAIDNGARGGVIFKSATGTLAEFSNSYITWGGDAFSTTPLVQLYILYSGTYSLPIYDGAGNSPEAGTWANGIFVTEVSATGCRVHSLRPGLVSYKVVAIGI